MNSGGSVGGWAHNLLWPVTFYFVYMVDKCLLGIPVYIIKSMFPLCLEKLCACKVRGWRCAGLLRQFSNIFRVSELTLSSWHFL